MKILYIGNSFSVDANTYLFEIAKNAGVDLETLNLYIGGCSLEMHAKHVQDNDYAYTMQYNGKFLPGSCTIAQALEYREWDYVSIQQASQFSGMYETYHPYIDKIIDKIKEICPNTKIVFHKTWAYEVGSEHPGFSNYGSSQLKMHKAICRVAEKITEEIKPFKVVDCGGVIAKLREYDLFNVERGGVSLCRDGFHLSLDYGRYALALTWFYALGMGEIDGVSVPFENADNCKINLIKKVVKETV